MQSDNPVLKANDVIQEVTSDLSTLCQCTISMDQITSEGFQCFPESPTAITFRAEIIGSEETSATQLVGFLVEWVSSGPVIRVQAELLNVDDSCDVEIASNSDPECVMASPSSSGSTVSPSGSNNAEKVVGSVLAVLVALVATITVM